MPGQALAPNGPVFLIARIVCFRDAYVGDVLNDVAIPFPCLEPCV